MKSNRIELLCWVAAGIMALTLVGQYVVYRTAPITAYGHASWDFHPTSFAEVINQADSVVVGEVTKIEAGQPIVVPAKGEPSGQDSIPTERITVRVEGSAKGETAAGSEVIVFRTGGQVQIPAGPPQTGAVDPGKGTERLAEPSGGKAGADVRAQALECLTSAVYYEAGNETVDGQRGVAQVVLNRVRHPAFPASVCGVVYQGSLRTTGCQFTFTCDGSLNRSPDAAGWARAHKVAADGVQMDETDFDRADALAELE